MQIYLPFLLSSELLPSIWDGHTVLHQHCAIGASCPIRSQRPCTYMPRCLSFFVSLPEDKPAPMRAGTFMCSHMHRLRRPHVGGHTQTHTYTLEHTCMLTWAWCPYRPAPICTGMSLGRAIVRMLQMRPISRALPERLKMRTFLPSTYLPQNWERPIFVPTTPSDVLGSASGILDLGNCLFQACWSGHYGSGHWR